MSRAAPRDALVDRLEQGLRALDTTLLPSADRLTAYLELLQRWNRAYNLSAVRDPLEMVPRHLLDSLSVLPHLEGESLLDVGSGAGLPGLPLAICRPQLQVVVLDSNSKKTRFMTQAALELGLDNVTVVHARIEAYRPGRKFATIISRAYARLDAFVRQTEVLLAPGGQWLAMKGRFDIEAEAGALATQTLQVIDLSVPQLDAVRTLVRIRPVA